MNPKPEILDRRASTQAPAPKAATPVTAFCRRGNGKIARLPKHTRDQINAWILDGLAYPDIIQRLGDQGKELTPNHFSEYKKRGYQDWLRQRDWFEHIAAKSEFSTDLLTAPDTASLHEAGLRVAAAHMLDQLMRFGADLDPGGSQPKPELFARLVNALSRLTREALACQKYHDACAKARADLQEAKDPRRKLNETETRAIVRKVDEILGLDVKDPGLDPAAAGQSPATGIFTLLQQQPSEAGQPAERTRKPEAQPA